MESVAQREAEKRKRIEEFQKKTKQNSKALITQNKADSKANEQKLVTYMRLSNQKLEEKLKKKAIEEKVKNPTVLKKAIKEHDHIVQGIYQFAKIINS